MGTFHLIVLFCNFVAENNRGFPKIGHSGSSARIVLKQKVQKSIDSQTKVELKIPQLTLSKIAQLARHETVNTRSEHYSPRVTS